MFLEGFKPGWVSTAGWGWRMEARINCHCEEVLVGVTEQRERKQVGSTYQSKTFFPLHSFQRPLVTEPKGKTI